MRTLAVVSRKGGVGKTTAACELAAAAARQGTSVVLIDYDSSANATRRLGVEPTPGLAALMLGRAKGSLEDLAVTSPWDPLLRVVPADGDLATVSEDTRPSWPVALHRAIHSANLDADLVLIDTGPSRSRLGYQALLAADDIIAVTTGEEDSVNAIAEAFDDAAEVVESGLVAPGPQVAGIVVAAAPLSQDGGAVRTRAPRELIEALSEAYGSLLWQPLVPLLPAPMAEARTQQVSAAKIPAAARVSAAYDALATTLLSSAEGART